MTKADIRRILDAAQEAGLTVFEFTATRQGVRIVTTDAGGKAGAAAENPWDKFLDVPPQ